MRRFVLSLSTCLSLLGSVCAQAATNSERYELYRVLAEIESGSLLRLDHINGNSFEGVLIAFSADSLSLASAEGGTERIDLAQVRMLWEQRYSRARGATIGGVIGAVLGGTGLAILFHKANRFGCGFDTGDCSDSSFSVLGGLGLAIGGVVGGLLGAEIGAASTTGRLTWIERYPGGQSRESPWSLR